MVINLAAVSLPPAKLTDDAMKLAPRCCRLRRSGWHEGAAR